MGISPGGAFQLLTLGLYRETYRISMFYDEHNKIPFQPDPEAVTPHRPPQLNEAICGSRCGCRCSKGEGGKNDDDSAATLVASDTSDAGEEYRTTSNRVPRHVNNEPAEQNDEIRARIGIYENGAEGFRVHPHVMGMEGVSFRPHRGTPTEDSDDDRAVSMYNHPPRASDEHSVVTPGARSVRCISPGPGLGAWADDFPLSEYHFLAPPLRLTPQHRYCRGLVASHLVARDDIAFMDVENGLGSGLYRVFRLE